jgi:hypothetical protein
MRLFMINVKTFIDTTVRVATAGGEIHTAVTEQIEHRRLFRELDRMVDR